MRRSTGALSASSSGARCEVRAAALARLPLPRVIDQDAPHRHRRRAVEVPAALDPHPSHTRSSGCTPRARAPSAAACDRPARAAAGRRPAAPTRDRRRRAAASRASGSPSFQRSRSVVTSPIGSGGNAAHSSSDDEAHSQESRTDVSHAALRPVACVPATLK